MCLREGENLMMLDESLGMGCGGRYDERKRDDRSVRWWGYEGEHGKHCSSPIGNSIVVEKDRQIILERIKTMWKITAY